MGGELVAQCDVGAPAPPSWEARGEGASVLAKTGPGRRWRAHRSRRSSARRLRRDQWRIHRVQSGAQLSDTGHAVQRDRDHGAKPRVRGGRDDPGQVLLPRQQHTNPAGLGRHSRRCRQRRPDHGRPGCAQRHLHALGRVQPARPRTGAGRRRTPARARPAAPTTTASRSMRSRGGCRCRREPRCRRRWPRSGRTRSPPAGSPGCSPAGSGRRPWDSIKTAHTGARANRAERVAGRPDCATDRLNLTG
jgi:hypothetical protein